MIFQSEPYFNNLEDKESSIKIHYYNSCFKEGILICHDLFYNFVIGNYAENLKEIFPDAQTRFPLTDTEKINYQALQRLMDYIKIKINRLPELFITPHIFTKFIHLLRERVLKNKSIGESHYKKIIELLENEFGHITEERLNKEDIIKFDCFRNKLFGLSEVSLLMLKNKKNHPCILSLSGKILTEYEEDFLYVNFTEVISFIKEEQRKNKS